MALLQSLRSDIQQLTYTVFWEKSQRKSKSVFYQLGNRVRAIRVCAIGNIFLSPRTRTKNNKFKFVLFLRSRLRFQFRSRRKWKKTPKLDFIALKKNFVDLSKMSRFLPRFESSERSYECGLIIIN